MQGKIVLIGGSKGGVGKSIVASALIDMMRHRNQPPIVVDSDTSNPDVYKCHKDILDCHTLDLDRKEGWIALLNIVHSTDKTVVINSAARNNTGVASFGSLLMDALPDLGRELVTFWVINRQRDSLELLNSTARQSGGKCMLFATFMRAKQTSSNSSTHRNCASTWKLQVEKSSIFQTSPIESLTS